MQNMQKLKCIIGGSILGLGFYETCREGCRQSKALNENSQKRLNLFKELGELHLENWEYPPFFSKNITALIKTEKEYQSVDTLIQNNPVFMFKKLIYGWSLIEDLKKKEEILPKDMPVFLKNRLLYSPCGWTGANEIELGHLMTSNSEYPMLMLERSQHLINNVSNSSQKMLQTKIELKSPSLSPERFNIFKLHAEKVQKEALIELECKIEDIRKIDEMLKTHMELDYCDTDNPRKLQLENDLREQIRSRELMTLAIEQYAMLLFINQDFQYENEQETTTNQNLIEKKTQNDAEIEVLLGDFMAYTAIAEGLETRMAILNLPNRLSKELAHCKAVNQYKTVEEWEKSPKYVSWEEWGKA